jgi:predicted small lipoprotein YifL
MKIARFALILTAFACISVLAACGNKGDLVRPTDNGAAAAN